MNRIIAITLTVLLVFGLAGCQGRESNSVFYGTAEMEQINISAETAGVVKEIKAAEGDTIQTGTVIALVDSPESTIKTEQAELSVKNASNELQKVNEGARAEEIAAQRAAVKQLAAQLDSATVALKQGEALLQQAELSAATALETYNYKNKLYNDALTLYKDGSTSKQEVDTAELNVKTARNAYEAAKAAIASAKAQLEMQKAQREGYRQQLEAANQRLAILVNGATATTKTTAELGVKQAETNYDLSKLAADRTEIKSQTAGITDSINFKVGEYITPGAAMATISNPDNIWVKIYVPEKLLPQLKLKQEVTVHSDFLTENVKGIITNIASQAEYTPMNTVTKHDRERLVYAVKVQVQDTTHKIKSGMLLDVILK